MSDSKSAVSALVELLARTRDVELDCDEFSRNLAALVDARLSDERLRALMDHHRRICPECERERAALLRALDRGDSDAG